MSPKLDIYSFIADIEGNKFNLSATIMHNEKDKMIGTKPLFDCGAGEIFMDQNFAWKNSIRTTKLDKPITARNIDGTLNKKGTIRYFTNLKIKIDGKTLEERFYITRLGDQKIISGFLWLKKHNPQIDWKTGSIIWKTDNGFSKRYAQGSQLKEEQIKAQMKLNQQPNIVEEVDPQEQDNQTLHPTLMEDVILEYLGMDNKTWINTKMTSATNLAAAANSKKLELTPEEIVPKEYHEFLDVFDEEKANCFSEPRPYNYKIKIKSGFNQKHFKGYNLTLEEQIKLDKFLKEILDKGYIKLLESPMASPLFFVKKKDGKL